MRDGVADGLGVVAGLGFRMKDAGATQSARAAVDQGRLFSSSNHSFSSVIFWLFEGGFVGFDRQHGRLQAVLPIGGGLSHGNWALEIIDQGLRISVRIIILVFFDVLCFGCPRFR